MLTQCVNTRIAHHLASVESRTVWNVFKCCLYTYSRHIPKVKMQFLYTCICILAIKITIIFIDMQKGVGYSNTSINSLNTVIFILGLHFICQYLLNVSILPSSYSVYLTIKKDGWLCIKFHSITYRLCWWQRWQWNTCEFTIAFICVRYNIWCFFTNSIKIQL